MEDSLKEMFKGYPSSAPDPEIVDYYALKSRRHIWLLSEIDENTLDVARYIFEYNLEDEGIAPEERKPIKIFLDTQGGDVQVTLAIIDAIKMSKTPVYTVNVCNAMSAGAHILAAGHKRFMMPSATVLIHSGSIQYGGDAEKAESARKFLKVLDDRLTKMLLEDTKIDPKNMKKKAPFDWYLGSEEALANGVVDVIMTDMSEVF